MAWNQIFLAASTRSYNGLSYTKVDNGHVTLNGELSGSDTWYVRSDTRKSISGHVYFVDKGIDASNYNVYNDSGGVDTTTIKRYTIHLAGSRILSISTRT